jgi:hypothetical protein
VKRLCLLKKNGILGDWIERTAPTAFRRTSPGLARGGAGEYMSGLSASSNIGGKMKRFFSTLTLAAVLLLATGLWAADIAAIKNNVDEMVAAINKGKTPTSYAADAYIPYAFIMDASGKLLVHPYLKGEFLQEKGEPIYKALQQATLEGTWVIYLWKGAQKHTYVRKTNNNLIVGSGY